MISLVWPHLEYASQVWDPYLQGDIDRLEAMQKFVFKLISQQWNSTGKISFLPSEVVKEENLSLFQVELKL